MMRIIFMGTPDFAVPALAAVLAAGHEVAAVYSQPPRAAGRGSLRANRRFRSSPRARGSPCTHRQASEALKCRRASQA